MPRTQAYPEAPEGYQYYGPDDVPPPSLQELAPSALPDAITASAGVPTYDPGQDQGWHPQAGTALGRLLGAPGQERYQTWPEKLLRESVAAPREAVVGNYS